MSFIPDKLREIIAREGHHWKVQERPPNIRMHHALKQTPWKRGAFHACQLLGHPVEWDWRSQGGKVAIKDQGNCGDCVAASAAAVLESNVKIALKQPDRVDDISIWDIFRQIPGATCDSGAELVDAWNVALNGVCDSGCLPYNLPNPPAPCADRANRLFKIGAYGQIQHSEDLKDAIYNQGPCHIGIDVYPSFEYYKSGVWTRLTTDVDSLGGHAVTAVGYHDPNPAIPGDVGYWIIQNSWGEGFGESGCIRVAYGANIGILDDNGGYPAYSIAGCTAPGANPNPNPNPTPVPTPSSNTGLIEALLVFAVLVVIALFSLKVI